MPWEGCAYVPKCSVQLITCKIYKVFEADSGIRLKAAVKLHFFSTSETK